MWIKKKKSNSEKIDGNEWEKKKCILNEMKFLLIFIPEIVFITILNILYTHIKYKVFRMSKVK